MATPTESVCTIFDLFVAVLAFILYIIPALCTQVVCNKIREGSPHLHV